MEVQVLFSAQRTYARLAQLVTCLPAGREHFNNMYTIYALIFKDYNRIYIGMTSNLAQRITDHERGHTKSIKNRGIFTVFIIEECESREAARNREKYWKSGCGKEQVKLSALSSAG